MEITAQVSFEPYPANLPPWGGSIDLACFAMAGEEACLRYTARGEVTGGPQGESAGGYTGLYLHWSTVSGAATFGEWPLPSPAGTPLSISPNTWSTLAISVDVAAGTVGIAVDGQRSPSRTAWFLDDPRGTVTLGLRPSGDTPWRSGVRFDNVVVAISRN